LNELIHIIETALGHAPSFFSDPQKPKNPFNNEEFSNAILYNIYFKMKDSIRLISTIFHLYFLSNFDNNNDKFVISNEAFLRDFSIKKYVFNTPPLWIHHLILEMIKENPYTRKLTIHKEFPKEQLVEIFRPFLYYSYIVNYDIRGTHKVSQYKRILYYKLKKFYEYNKGFGRKIIELIPNPNTNTNQNVNTILSHLLDKPTGDSNKKKSRRMTRVTYNSKHIGFYNIDMSDIQSEIEEAAQILVYFSANVDNDLSEEEDTVTSLEEDTVASLEEETVASLEEETVASLEEESLEEEQNVVTNINDPEVSTLEDSETNNSDDENSTQHFNEDQNNEDQNINDYDYNTESDYDYDEEDSIS